MRAGADSRAGRDHKQRGAVLILSLVVLAIMTILGVTVMGTSTLELRMSGNAIEKTVAFNDAEDTRGKAEAAVNAVVDQMETAGSSFNAAVSALGYSGGFYDLSGGGAGPGVDLVAFWQDPTLYQQVGGVGSGYAIEYLGVHALYLDRLTAPTGGGESLMHVFRLTVVGAGADGAQTAVQAVYMRN